MGCFLPFYTPPPLPPLPPTFRAQKTKIKNMKRSSRDIIILANVYQRLWLHDVWFLRYGAWQTDRQTDRQTNRQTEKVTFTVEVDVQELFLFSRTVRMPQQIEIVNRMFTQYKFVLIGVNLWSKQVTESW